jgi:hypothetical protein
MRVSYTPVVGSVVLAIAMSLACANLLAAADGDDESWRQRFLTEAPRKWEEYREHSDRFQGSFSMVCSGLTGRGTTYEKITVEIKQNQARGCALLIGQNEGRREQEALPQSLSAINPQYKFTLAQSGPKGSWLLVSREPAETQRKSASDITLREVVQAYTNHGTALRSGFDQIASLMRHPEFKIANVTRIEKNGTALARVDIEFRPEREDDLRYSWLRKGWLLFDPQRYWFLVEYEGAAEREGGMGTMHGSYEYENGPGGLPILQRQLVTFKGKEADGKPIDLVYDFQFNFAEGEVPESEFYLEAYQLVDTAAVEQAALAKFRAGMEQKKGKALPTYICVLIGAGVCGAMALTFRYLARRRRVPVA